MTLSRAIIKARVEWGKTGHARETPPWKYKNGQDRPTHVVGLIEGVDTFGFFMVKGQGMSFEEAFADAERTKRHGRMDFRLVVTASTKR